ncbi:hypothetical protein HKX48_007276 [Thoreauomyces humboldtii]|nr:hypothetical protein HKX48_007276 [Thoreauomyces humboldtii]
MNSCRRWAVIRFQRAIRKVIAQVAEAHEADVDAAVRAAHDALKLWQKLPASDRGRMLQRCADLLVANAADLADIESRNSGKTLRDALDEVHGASDVFRYFGGWADKIAGRVLDFDPTLHAFTRLEPVGVVGQIIPWNYPLSMLAWKLAPALACGNAVVLKTSEKTPLSALKACELTIAPVFPPGTVNILSGAARAGEAIARHPGIKKVAFTGSTAVGRRIMSMAADSNLKKVTLELGGKSANIVFADADLAASVDSCFGGAYDNLGQNCCAGSRIFVQEDIYDEFVDLFKEKLSRVVIGDPRDPATTFGPLVDEKQLSNVLSLITSGVSEGAQLTGGDHLRGCFLAPALFTQVTPSMRIYTEEIFGPVACIVRFKSEDEVVHLANDTPYGLAAGVHTRDVQRAVRVEKLLEAGIVWINTYNAVTPPHMPFGGYKQSGIGRELGEYGLQEYTQVKSVMMKLG